MGLSESLNHITGTIDQIIETMLGLDGLSEDNKAKLLAMKKQREEYQKKVQELCDSLYPKRSE
jgi:hypothetical protein